MSKYTSIQPHTTELDKALTYKLLIYFKVSMMVPFMRAYTERLVKICHKHGAHAMGGMSAFIPSRHDEEINKRAFSQVRGDKEREVADGFDGTWVAHPDLVQVNLIKCIFINLFILACKIC